MDTDKKDPRSHAIIGAAMEVHNVLGHGFLESVYQEALALEFEDKGIPYGREVTLPIRYKGRQLPAEYRADFICFSEILVELKALRTLSGHEEGQILNYLKASDLGVGLLFNFGESRLRYK